MTFRQIDDEYRIRRTGEGAELERRATDNPRDGYEMVARYFGRSAECDALAEAVSQCQRRARLGSDPTAIEGLFDERGMARVCLDAARDQAMVDAHESECRARCAAEDRAIFKAYRF